jgi:uncharacterized protein
MIHQYKLGGFNIVVDGCSASVHLVDDLAYDVIGLFETKTPDEIVFRMLEKYAGVSGVTEAEIREVIGDVEELKVEGKLFSPDLYEDMGAVQLPDGREDVVKALCLHVSHACNLTCNYCFASQGNYHGDRALMSPEVGRRAIDFLISIRAPGTTWRWIFSAEAALKQEHVNQTRGLCPAGSKRNTAKYRYLTTNGVLQDEEIMEFSNREMHNVYSAVGRKEVHDRLKRTFSQGQATT